MTYTEYETSVRLPITKFIFDSLYKKFYNENSRKIVISYFNDPILSNNENSNLHQGYRLTDNIFQNKYCLHRLNLLKILINKSENKQNQCDFYNGRNSNKIMFIPFTRTTAKETIVETSQRFDTIRDIIIRSILYQENDMRVCIEKISEGHHGGSYYFSAEIEYNMDYSEMNYNLLTEKESIFWNTLSEIYFPVFYHDLDSNLIYNYVELSQLLHIPCRKFSPFHEYSCNMTDYKLKYKFDGYKGRMICNNVKPNSIIYWDDMHNAGKIISSFLNDFPHIIFQYEIISNKQCIILTDIIGTIFHRQLYMPEPNDVLLFFSLFPRRDVNSPLLADNFANRTFSLLTPDDNHNNDMTNNTFHIGVQFTITGKHVSHLLAPPLPDTDGFIVVCNNREYKYKIPTLDVRIRNEFAFLDESTVPIFDIKLLSTFLLNPTSVYEITLRKGQVIVLRERFERQFTSNMDEFTNFKKELAFMSQQLQLMNA